MTVPPAFPYLVVAVVVVAVLRRMKRRDGSTLPLPPGPPRLPVIGNMLDMPKHNMHETFRDMCAKYGVTSVNTIPTSKKVYRAQVCLPAFLTPFQAIFYTSTCADNQ